MYNCSFLYQVHSLLPRQIDCAQFSRDFPHECWIITFKTVLLITVLNSHYVIILSFILTLNDIRHQVAIMNKRLRNQRSVMHYIIKGIESWH
jgi:hypothetical protein